MYKFELLAFVLSFHPYLLSKSIVFKSHHTRSPKMRLSQIALCLRNGHPLSWTRHCRKQLPGRPLSLVRRL